MRQVNELDDFQGVRLEPPDFEGTIDPQDFIDWSQTMERIFEAKSYSEQKSCKLAIIKLKKYAPLWYESVEHKRAREGKRKVTTWTKLKSLMQKRFVLASYKQELYLSLTSLKQDDLSVLDYIQRFEQLMIQVDLDDKEEHKIARFVHGLNPSIAERLEMHQVWLFEDACKLALKIERQLKTKKVASRTFVKNPS